MSYQRILVKVGKKSNIKLSKAIAERAITIQETFYKINSKQFDLLIIEGINEQLDEVQKIVDACNEKKLDMVVFGSSRVAKEYNIKKIETIEELQQIVYEKTGVNVFTDINKRVKSSEEKKQDNSVENNNEFNDAQADESTHTDTKDEKASNEVESNSEIAHKVQEEHKRIEAEQQRNIAELKKRETELNRKVENLQEEKNDLLRKISKTQEEISKVTNRKDEEIRVQKEECNRAIEENKKLTNKVQELSNKISELDEQSLEVEKCNDKIAELESSIERYKNDIGELRDTNQEYRDKVVKKSTMVDGYQRVTKNIIDALYIQTKSNKEIRESLTRVKEEKERIEINANSLSSNNRNEMDRLANENIKLKSEAKSVENKLNEELRNKNEEIVKLNGEVNKWRARAVNNNNGEIDETIIVKECNSRIITVTGSGSNGITTTAMTIAETLSSTNNVVFIDLDMDMPMADAWFMKNPVIEGNSMKNTGLAMFLEEGIGKIRDSLNNMNNLEYCGALIKVKINRGGQLRYLSGIYYDIEEEKVYTANYSELFDALSEKFEYIIIDMGKLGRNRLSKRLYKAISDIAYKNIVVTENDVFEIRNFKARLDMLHIKTDNINWLINRSKTTAVADRIKTMLYGYKYGVVPNVELQENVESFNKNSLTKSKFYLAVEI